MGSWGCCANGAPRASKGAGQQDTHRAFVRQKDQWTEGYKSWVLLRHADYETQVGASNNSQMQQSCPSHNASSQYAGLYFGRLQKMRDWLKPRIQSLDLQQRDLPVREKLIDVCGIADGCVLRLMS